MDLCVPPALALNVAFDDVFVCVLAYGVHVEATGPEMPSPENLLHLGMMVEDVLGRETLDDLCQA